MWDAASAVERARRAFASVAEFEAAIERDPADRSLQINLLAVRKMARQAQERLFELAERDHVEVCSYRLVPAVKSATNYALAAVTRSMFEYQNLFSQIHDALRNGKKQNAVIQAEAAAESLLEFGYSYSGSLGVILFVPSQQTLFDGTLDRSIEALFQVIEIEDQDDVRTVAHTLGIPVVKRVHQWSESNVKGGFAADLKWRRSDGRQLGELITRDRMARIVEVVEKTSDTVSTDIYRAGTLIGIDMKGGTFRFTDPLGEDYRGTLGPDFPREERFTVNRVYDAYIVEKQTTRYATETVEKRYSLMGLRPRAEPPLLEISEPA